MKPSEIEAAQQRLKDIGEKTHGVVWGTRFVTALTHPSYAHETGQSDNQRLEFLGDSVLGLCTSEQLWALFPEASEGQLTRMRAELVNAQSLADWARSVNLLMCLRVGRGARAGKEHEGTNVLSDAVEALVAAAYLDGGMSSARAMVAWVIGARLAETEKLGGLDPKSALQEAVQAQGMPTPVYREVEAVRQGREVYYVVTVHSGEQCLGEGRGIAKKLAEREAANVGLAALAELVAASVAGPPAAKCDPTGKE